MRLKLLRAAALVAAFVLFAPAQAALLVGEGVAPLDGGAAVARDLAVRDALKMIALHQGARVESVQVSQQGNASESGVLTATGGVSGKVRVLDERSDGKLYRVRIQLDTSVAAAKGVDAGCPMPVGRALRRRLVTTYFHVSRPAEASDMPELATLLPVELSRRLGAGKQYIVRSASAVSVLPDPRVAEPATGWEVARRIGAHEDAQFVVSGRVLSTAVVDQSLRYSQFDGSSSQQGSYYVGPLAGLLGGAVQYRPTQRQFDAEIWIYDGLTGALLANERVSEIGQGKVMPPAPRPFGSAAFWQSDYGRAVDMALDKAGARVREVIACIPFSARVVKVDEGGRVFLNAGLLDGLSVGDKLLLYKPQSGQAVRDLVSGRELGVPEEINGDLAIVQLQPNFAIAVPQNARLKVEEGDYARFMPIN